MGAVGGQEHDREGRRRLREALDTPDGSPTGEATCCAVSVRRWAERRRWAQDKTKDGRWKAVRGYGVDDLEAWLETTPVTHAWISEDLGLRPHRMRTPTAWWEPWAAATEPSFAPDLVLSGRDRDGEALAEALRGAPQVTTLRGDSPDEVLAVTAVLLRDKVARGDLLARALFVDDVAAWRRLSEHPRGLVLVARTAEVQPDSRRRRRRLSGAAGGRVTCAARA